MAPSGRAKRKASDPGIARARVVILAPTGRLAMIERTVDGRRFLSVPGGRLEPGETPEAAAVREVEEELGLRVDLAGRLGASERQAYFLAVVPAELPLHLGGPEARHDRPRNRYRPRWVDALTLDGLPLRHEAARPWITAGALAAGATASVVAVHLPDGAAGADDAGLPGDAGPPGGTALPDDARDGAPVGASGASAGPDPDGPRGWAGPVPVRLVVLPAEPGGEMARAVAVPRGLDDERGEVRVVHLCAARGAGTGLPC